MQVIRQFANLVVHPCFAVFVAFAAVQIAAAHIAPTATIAADGQAAQPIPGNHISIDATDLPRKLLTAEIHLNLPGDSSTARRIPLWYPKWVPGAHGPGGPIANVAGLMIDDGQGNEIPWQRTGGEVYRIEASVPAGTSVLRVRLKYIANQPTTNSMGHDCFGTPLLGLISPSALMMYVEGTNVNVDPFTLQVQLPIGWSAAAGLQPLTADTAKESIVRYQAESLRTLADSPIMCGKYLQVYELTDASGQAAQAVPHRLHVFADTSTDTNIPDEILEKLRAMVTQTAILTRSQPFSQFEVLLAVTDSLSPNGLEHSRSSMNILPRAALRSLASLKGWNRLLIPHEYLHAWCGKYRQPAGMTTDDFHTPLDTELLWVYEGLTQYLGELVEARCGLMSVDEFRHRLNVELRNAVHQQGRQWRSLADTGAASHVLRDSSKTWPGLRRSQDYYMEGMLFWIEADAIIRESTGDTKSLDDFCHIFFAYASDSPHPRPYDRQEIITSLQALVPNFDWNGLIQRRIESPQQHFDTRFVERLGYRFALSDKQPSIPAETFRHRSGIDAYDSLGAMFSQAGDVLDILLESPADLARIAPGMRIIGVNGRTWSAANLADALGPGRTEHPLELLIADNDVLRTIQILHYAGPRFWTLEPPADPANDRLLKILAPR
jgi:predicted metalloprotease with PDZ domain